MNKTTQFQQKIRFTNHQQDSQTVFLRSVEHNANHMKRVNIRVDALGSFRTHSSNKRLANEDFDKFVCMLSIDRKITDISHFCSLA